MMKHTTAGAYKYEDASGSLADELRIDVSNTGLIVGCLDTTHVNHGQHWTWDQITDVRAMKPSDDPDDMEEVHLHVQQSGRFIFEVDNARELRAEINAYRTPVQLDVSNPIAPPHTVFPVEDPTRSLPEETVLQALNNGVQLAELTVCWGWHQVTGIKVQLEEDDPELMEFIVISIAGFGDFSFECEEARAIEQELAEYIGFNSEFDTVSVSTEKIVNGSTPPPALVRSGKSRREHTRRVSPLYTEENRRKYEADEGQDKADQKAKEPEKADLGHKENTNTEMDAKAEADQKAKAFAKKKAERKAKQASKLGVAGKKKDQVKQAEKKEDDIVDAPTLDKQYDELVSEMEGIKSQIQSGDFTNAGSLSTLQAELENIQVKRKALGLPDRSTPEQDMASKTKKKQREKKDKTANMLAGLKPKRASIEGAKPAPPVYTLPAGWAEHKDPATGGVYYYNTASGKTQWEKPEPDATPPLPPVPAVEPEPAPAPAPAPSAEEAAMTLLAQEQAALEASKKELEAEINQLPMFFPGVPPDPSVFTIRIFKDEKDNKIPAKANVLKEETRDGMLGFVIQLKSHSGKEKECWKSIGQFEELRDRLSKSDLQGIKFPTKLKKEKNAKKRIDSVNAFLRPLILRANNDEFSAKQGKKVLGHLAKESVLSFLYEDESQEDLAESQKHKAEDQKERKKLLGFEDQLNKYVSEQREILKRTHLIISEYMASDDYEVPADEQTIGDHKYSNDEPTKTLRSFRNKMLLLNTSIMNLSPQISQLKASVERRIQGGERRRQELDDDKCLVCHLPFKDNDQLRVLPCIHSFHSDCLTKWFGAKITCVYGETEKEFNTACPCCQKPCFKQMKEADMWGEATGGGGGRNGSLWETPGGDAFGGGGFW